MTELSSLEFIIKACKMAGLNTKKINEIISAYKMISYGKENN